MTSRHTLTSIPSLLRERARFLRLALANQRADRPSFFRPSNYWVHMNQAFAIGTLERTQVVRDNRAFETKVLSIHRAETDSIPVIENPPPEPYRLGLRLALEVRHCKIVDQQPLPPLFENLPYPMGAISTIRTLGT